MLLLVLTLAVFMPVSANAAPKTNQWVNKGGYRYYYNQKGKKVKNKVKQIGKFRYSFDKKGRMQTGWQIFGSKMCRLPVLQKTAQGLEAFIVAVLQ